MTPAERHALRIARDALDLDTVRRSTFLHEHCEGNVDLRARVERLLQRIEQIETADPGSNTNGQRETTVESDALIGAQLGPFRIVERIGRGGTGVVYRGERTRGDFDQVVAIKLIRRGFDFDEVRARFLRERRILAQMNHPHLARFIDGGVADDGRPWFALEHVQGEPITRWCDRLRLDVRARVRLLIDVCTAVQYAHTQLVVHRDLKPGNILVDENGAVRLLDFGIAQLLFDPSGDRSTRTTIAGQRGFTPEYAAPEQFTGDPTGVASDIYSLGVVAYELIAGVLPRDIARNDFNTPQPPTSQPVQSLTQAIGRTDRSAAVSPGRDGASTHGTTSRIPSDTPDSSLERRLAARSTTLRSYRHQVRGDLSRILDTALADEPERRYPTVAAFADDLQRWLDGVPVRVSGNRLGYRLTKFVKRNRLPVALLGACILLALVGVTGIVWQARQATHAATRAVAVKSFLANLLTSANPFIKPGDTPTVRDLLDEAGKRIETEFHERPALAAELLGVVGASYRGLGEMTLADRYLGHAIALSDDISLEADVLGSIRSEYLHVLIGQNKSRQAVQLGRETLAMLPSSKTRLRAEILLGIATALRFEDDAPGALSAAQEATDLACSHENQYSQTCVQTLIELKYFHEFSGDESAALSTAREAWERSERLHGDQPNPQRVQAAGAYGVALALNGSYDEAIALLRRTVDLARDIYGENNFRYARALDWLAAAYDEAGRLPEALTTTEEAFLIGRETLPRSPLAGFWLHRMARLQLDLLQPDAAEATLALVQSETAEQLPGVIADGLAVDRLRLHLMTQSASPELSAEAIALADRLAGTSSPMGATVDLLAIEAAMNAGDTTSASRLFDRYVASGSGSGNATQHGWRQMLNARLLLARDDAAAAASMARDARTSLESPSVDVARQALGTLRLAQVYCMMDDHAVALELFAQARRLWQDGVDSTRVPDQFQEANLECDVTSSEQN